MNLGNARFAQTDCATFFHQGRVRGRMGRGSVLFAIFVLLLPAALFVGAIAAPAYAVGLALSGLAFLTLGLTLGVVVLAD